MAIQIDPQEDARLVGAVYLGANPDLLWVVVLVTKESLLAVSVNVVHQTVGERISLLYGQVEEFREESNPAYFIRRFRHAWDTFRQLHESVAVKMLSNIRVSELGSL